MKKKEKKYIVNVRIGITIFVVLVIVALGVFSTFYLIQNKEDREFQTSRQGILNLINQIEDN